MSLIQHTPVHKALVEALLIFDFVSLHYYRFSLAGLMLLVGKLSFICLCSESLLMIINFRLRESF